MSESNLQLNWNTVTRLKSFVLALKTFFFQITLRRLFLWVLLAPKISLKLKCEVKCG